jgi:hypothetical protein
MVIKYNIVTNLRRAIEEMNYPISNPEGAKICVKAALKQINTLLKNGNTKEKRKKASSR